MKKKCQVGHKFNDLDITNDLEMSWTLITGPQLGFVHVFSPQRFFTKVSAHCNSVCIWLLVGHATAYIDFSPAFPSKTLPGPSLASSLQPMSEKMVVCLQHGTQNFKA